MATRFADNAADDARMHHRTHLCLAAFIDCDGQRSSVRIRDLSRDGARIEASPPPPVDRPILLTRGSLTATGQTVWCDRDRCGIRFDRKINLESWLPVRDMVRTQDDVDRVVADIRRTLQQNATPPAASRDSGSLPARLAGELEFAVRMIESLRDAVASEPQMIAKHPSKLPYFDRSLELLRQVSAIIASPDPAVAVDRITDASLRRRLTRSSI